ncbi:MAG: type III-B CRISPR-associated protein Cas10/Cmr2 [Desulfurivibrio sp.]|nr:MAG: type III-B CRISPR-associated protein Cas10/Cmr2 [Desulfurivibrio sp.]
MTNDILWQTKVAAWVHDPAEKALVLLRDPAGHEGGTVAKLKKALFPNGVPDGIKARVKRADHWAAAADRPQFPQEKEGGRYQHWAQVRFAEQPELIHPLSGERIDIQGGLGELDPAHLKAVSTDHFEQHIVHRGSVIDWRGTALAFWRFGPDPTARKLDLLWSLLPADTRVPDHTIWAHLDLASAFAGAFATDANDTPALLTMSFGPVQDFIAQARSTSDLWAGSHLLSRMVWEGLKVVCEELGPDAVLFPQLRGIPLVDLWLQEEMGIGKEWFANLEWRKRETDANPLFSAALPNRFMAVVPTDRAKSLADAIKDRVRAWVQEQARETVIMLLKEAGIKGGEDAADVVCYPQAEKQLTGFPEVYWAAVPWSLVGEGKEKAPDVSELTAAMAPFFPEQDAPGFLGSEVWKILGGNIDLGDAAIYRPNPGVLYPALYDLLDRLAAAAKSTRPFGQLLQHGYRCTLCGEREWLTTNREQLDLPPGKRKDTGTLWTRVAREKPAWARKGEHLCGLCAVKRLWPSRFVDSVRRTVDLDVHRYVVSTHTMALTTSMEKWLDQPARNDLSEILRSQLESREQSALPRKLATRLLEEDKNANLLVRRLPAFMDYLKERTDSVDLNEREQAKECLDKVEKELKAIFGHNPEAYYGLIMMDGDRMGAWLNGSEDKYRLPFAAAWHSQVRGKAAELGSDNQALQQYLAALRPPSPARHMAISGALNGFSLELARHVVEDLYKGKLLYSGGDDVLAMVSVDDLLPVLLLLRLVYGGIFPGRGTDNDMEAWRNILSQEKAILDIGRGHVRYKKRLYRMMGEKATASAGAVVAHHTAPLGMVLRTLRQAEKRAKNKGDRDAFSVTLLKRSGGAVELTCPWLFDPSRNEKAASLAASPMGLLIALRNAFAFPDLSRRAAYIIQDWVTKLPEAALLAETANYGEMLAVNLAYQFKRQSKGKTAEERHASLGRELASLALAVQDRSGRDNPAAFITDFIAVAEFLAREGRTGNKGQQGGMQ